MTPESCRARAGPRLEPANRAGECGSVGAGSAETQLTVQATLEEKQEEEKQEEEKQEEEKQEEEKQEEEKQKQDGYVLFCGRWKTAAHTSRKPALPVRSGSTSTSPEQGSCWSPVRRSPVADEPTHARASLKLDTGRGACCTQGQAGMFDQCLTSVLTHQTCAYHRTAAVTERLGGKGRAGPGRGG